MGALLNRARMTTATTGTGTITLGSASTGFATFAEAGATNATAYSYCIEDGNDFEIGVGTYTSSGTTFSRDTVTLSKISGTAGTTKLTLSGSATIFITARAQEIATLDAAQTFTATQTITPAANTSALVSSAGSLTGANAQSLIDLAQTWNTSGTPTLIKANVTNTASNAASLLMDLQVGGTSQFRVSRSGTTTLANDATFVAPTAAAGATTLAGGQIMISSTASFPKFSCPNLSLATAANIGSAYFYCEPRLLAFGSADGTNFVNLNTDAAHILAQRNGTNAQTARLYRTFTDASNYQRLAQFWNTTTAVIHNEGAGTGADGSIAFNDAALATTATRGFIMAPSCAGVPTGVPADIPTGQIPLVYDTTNNRIYAYNGSWRQVAVT